MVRVRVPIIHPCSTAGCFTLTMGVACLQCEAELQKPAEDDLPDALTLLPADPELPPLEAPGAKSAL